MREDPRHDLGRTGENLAAEHLERLGYRILERNYRTRWGELDIVAYDGHALTFCEVKSRRAWHGADSVAPLAAVNRDKQVRVRRMAASWLCERTARPWADELRVDAIGVTFDLEGRVTALQHLEGAF